MSKKDGKLRYSVYSPGEGKLSFTIENQPEGLTTFIKSRRGQCFNASNGWKVAISMEPEVDIKNRVVYLRGDDSDMDDRVHSHWGLGGKKEIGKIINQIDKAMEEAFAASKAWTPARTFEIEKVHVVDLYAYDPFAAYRNNPRIVIIDRR